MTIEMYSEADMGIKGDVKTMKNKSNLSVDRDLRCSETVQEKIVQLKRITL